LIENRGNKALFRCDCGTEVERFKSNIVSGKSTQCATCGFRQSSETKTGGYSDDWVKHQVYRYFVRSAKDSKKEFNLDEDTCWHLSQQPCYYCGEPPALSVMRAYGQFNFNGLDRIDSSRGYEVGNIRPACWDCNSAKKTMTDEDFDEWIEKLYNMMIARKYAKS
jgi:hypothetical protein